SDLPDAFVGQQGAHGPAQHGLAFEQTVLFGRGLRRQQLAAALVGRGRPARLGTRADAGGWNDCDQFSLHGKRHFIMMDYMATETNPSLTLPSTPRVLAALKPGQRHAQPLPPGSGD